MTEKHALEVRDLNISCKAPGGKLRALRHINMAVPRGEIVGLVGESGCGKTTLMQTILGLQSSAAIIESGQILLGETDLLKLGSPQMRGLLGDRISAVFQDPMKSLNPVLTIGRQMTDIQFRKASATRNSARVPSPCCKRCVSRTRRHGLINIHSSFPAEYVSVLQQRALMAEPDVLVADEPTTALDAALELATIDLVRDLQQEIGCAIIFITHHLGVVAELCQSVNIMYAGELVESGPTRVWAKT